MASASPMARTDAHSSALSTARLRYQDWVQRHAGFVSAAEESVRTMLLMLPGRFSNSELGSESISTLVNLISLYHRDLIGEPHLPTATICGFGNSANIDHGSCLSILAETQISKRVRHVIGIVQHLEVLIEMLARRHLSKNNRWTLVVAIESLKASCRLLLLYKNGGRMMISATREEAIHQHTLSKAHEQCEMPHDSQCFRQRKDSAELFTDLQEMYRRHGRGDTNPHGHFANLSQNDKAPVKVTHVIAEVLHIARPVIFAVGILLCRPKRSWKPLLASVSADIGCRLLLGKLSSLSARQAIEVRRRMWLWLWYLLRTPVFEVFTKRPIARILTALSSFPVVGVFFENMLDLAISLQSHHFYTSAS